MKYYLLSFILTIFCVHITCSIIPKLHPISMNKRIKNDEVCSEKCLECFNSECKKCQRGFYSYKNQCLEKCPNGLLADNYSLTCKAATENPVFIKAYTISRCTNKCGAVFRDCSCNEDCKKDGSCCSDYKYCDFVYDSIKETKINHRSCDIKNCKSCTNATDNSLCLMCDDEFYYYKNKCLPKCPDNTYSIDSNNICMEKSACGIDNCEICDISNTKCNKCIHGFFLNENECLKSCPAGTRADRIKFTCTNKTSFSFYMIFPSKGSCSKMCGISDLKSDCSCHNDCLKESNCCDDFEKECQIEIKKEKCKACINCNEGKCKLCAENSELHNGDCVCKTGYFYDRETDKCELGFGKKRIEKRVKQDIISFESPISEYKQNPNLKEYPENTLSNMLKSLFHNFETEKNSHYGLINPKSNVEVRGNITLNIFEGNTNPNIVNEKIVNQNSFNNSTIIEKNINSHNSFINNKFVKEEPKDVQEEKKDDKQEILKDHDGSGLASTIFKNVLKPPVVQVAELINSGLESEDSSDYRKKPSLRFRNTEDSIKQYQKKLRKKAQIEIKKHNHIDHEMKFPEDLDHDENREMEMPKPKGSKKKNSVIKKDKEHKNEKNAEKNAEKHQNNHNKTHEHNDYNKNLKSNNKKPYQDKSHQNNQNNHNNNENHNTPNNFGNDKNHYNNAHLNDDHNGNYNPDTFNNQYSSHSFNDKLDLNDASKILEAKTDKNKKLNLNIIIPNQDGNGEEKRVQNKITVYNHYFVNDKSTTLNNPKNPNIFNIYGKEGNKIDFEKFDHPKYIDDKNYKELNNTITYEKGGVYLVDRHDSKQFSLPESQRHDIRESFMKNKVFRKNKFMDELRDQNENYEIENTPKENNNKKFDDEIRHEKKKQSKNSGFKVYDKKSISKL